jgi:cell division protein FtsI (penicillin-binding protein 3)
MNDRIKQRVIIIFLLFSLFFCALLTKIFILQIAQAGFFNKLANQQHHIRKTTRPLRAEIYDRNGIPLALNKDSYAAFITPLKLEQKEAVFSFLKQHFPQAYTRLAAHEKTHFLFIKRRLSEKERLLIKNAGLTDIKILNEPSRFYPTIGAQSLIGLTDIDNNGILGLEMKFNNHLAGKPTTSHLEKDARSGHFYFKEKMTVQGVLGQSLHLTLDGTLQFLVYEELKEKALSCQAEEGAVLILNPVTGEIIVMANYPDFDSHATLSETNQYYSKNRIVTERYELGSVIKIFLMLAALEEKVVKPDEIIDCMGTESAIINGVKVGTWKAHGALSFSDIIAQSNNIGCAKIAQRLGNALYDHYVRLGFTKKTELGFAGEQTGFILSPEKWSNSTLFTLSYGYGISITLLQLARAFCTLSNGGFLLEPYLIKNLQNKNVLKAIYSEQTLNDARAILEGAITHGTAKKAKINGYRVFGKTGTANILENGSYNTHHNLFTFVGSVEKGDYNRVIVTFIKGKGNRHTHASSITAPLFEAVAQKMLIHDKIL